MSETIATLVDKESGTIIRSKFDKYFTNDDYEIYFNTKSGLEVLRGRDEKPDPFYTELPTLLDIGVMGHCHNQCGFCYQGETKQPNMTFENFKTIIDQVKHHVNQIALGGRGDPNKHKEFKKIIEYSRKNNVAPNYTTSGKNLTDEEIEISKMCGAVAVSDYGNSYTYEAIQRFIDAGIKTNIHLMFTAATFQKCLKIILGYNPWKGVYADSDFFDIEKLNAVIFLLFKGRGANCPDMAPSNYELKVVAESILKSRNTFKIGMDSCLANHIFKFTKVEGLNKLSIDSCEGARMSAYITPDMKMMPCSFADHSTFSVPMEKSIEQIWQKSKQFKKFRSVLKKNPFSCPAGF
jgi:MoaA/NifB/PqqE/SkfB family radical SAM enzyme